MVHMGAVTTCGTVAWNFNLDIRVDIRTRYLREVHIPAPGHMVVDGLGNLCCRCPSCYDPYIGFEFPSTTRIHGNRVSFYPFLILQI